MSIKIEVDIQRSTTIDTHAHEAFSRIATVEEMASHFPKLERLEQIDDLTYSWVLEKIGTEAYKHRVEYTSKWEWHDAERKVTWEPVKGAGNTQISGICHVKEVGEKSEVHFSTKATMILPLPRWTKAIAKPVVKKQFEALIDTYINNVVAAMA